MVAHQDVIITVLGASAALAGLVLVFVGIVVTTFQGYGTEQAAAVRSAFRHDALLTLAPFTLGVASVGCSTAWLLTRNNQPLYIATLVTFIGQLVLLLLAAFLVTRRVLWTS
jgi:hypothetical protein